MAQIFVNGKRRFLSKIITRKRLISKFIIEIFEIPTNVVVTAFQKYQNFIYPGFLLQGGAPKNYFCPPKRYSPNF